MPYIEYLPKAFNAEHEGIIKLADVLCGEYMADGYTLTVRQLYYLFVSRDVIPNTIQEYKRFAGIINDARLAGRLDWKAFEDRLRELEALPHWDGTKNFLRSVMPQYKADLWEDQPIRIEVWVEKDALSGVVGAVCDRYRVPYMACRGYASQSALWQAGQRFTEYVDHGQQVAVLHLGDHDPSGIDMTRDNNDRIIMFTGELADQIEVERLALNLRQVQRYKPPPNPAKISDSRASNYISLYGAESWELDALEPSVIAALISTAIESRRDQEKWDAAVERETSARKRLTDMAQRWKGEPEP